MFRRTSGAAPVLQGAALCQGSSPRRRRAGASASALCFGAGGPEAPPASGPGGCGRPQSASPRPPR